MVSEFDRDVWAGRLYRKLETVNRGVEMLIGQMREGPRNCQEAVGLVTLEVLQLVVIIVQMDLSLSGKQQEEVPE